MTGVAAGPGAARGQPGLRGRWAVLGGAVAASAVLFAAASIWGDLAGVGRGAVQAAWLLPGLAALHLGQLFLAGLGWHILFGGAEPALATSYRLRIMREGIDALLPVAQVGGEIVAARLLTRQGMPAARAGASIIVDVTFELLTQVAFLLTAVCLLATLSGGPAWRGWLAVLAAGAAATAAVAALQRFGGLRALEGLLRGMARRWPPLAGASLDGIHAEALGFYRNRRAVWGSVTLHYVAWALGSVETWAVLNALGVPVSPVDAFIIESLGMAARSAGFAIPGALGAQEGGFVLAGAAVGVAAAPALALSLVKRMREMLVGSVGLLLWRAAARTGPAA